jgi:hypothetical protein
MRDLLTGRTVHLEVGGGSVSFPMDATSSYVLVPEGS